MNRPAAVAKDHIFEFRTVRFTPPEPTSTYHLRVAAAEWTVRRSWAHHEAGHVVAGHLCGYDALSSTVEYQDDNDPDECGGATCIDCNGDDEAQVLIALAAPIAEERFDSEFAAPQGWNEFRRGICCHDVTAAQQALRRMAPRAEIAVLIEMFTEGEQRARKLLEGAGVSDALERVANRLDLVGTLDADELIRLVDAIPQIEHKDG
jgi:hypothetical protein